MTAPYIKITGQLHICNPLRFFYVKNDEIFKKYCHSGKLVI